MGVVEVVRSRIVHITAAGVDRSLGRIGRTVVVQRTFTTVRMLVENVAWTY